MPQVKRGARDSGLHVPGIYQGLLDEARAHYERRCGRGEPLVVDGREVGRGTLAGVDEHGQPRFFFHSRARLDWIEAVVEAGKAVGISRCEAERAMWELDRSVPWNSCRLPFGRTVKRVHISPDDHVVPIADLDGSDAA